ncbi:MAG: RNA methyltransferase [Flavobacteriaceae bacterium]|nr:RNA methyltransferase [Flavobacteriaceae bacterium]
MPSKTTLKLIKRLQQKKYRKTENLFVVEGKKSVLEFLKSDFKLRYFYVNEMEASAFPLAEIASSQEFNQMSGLNTSPDFLAVFEQKNDELPSKFTQNCLVLDDIQDPGNFGTIIRLADWFGIEHVICSSDTVDAYNPKVIQASMGSFTRVKIHYTDVFNFLSNSQIPVYGTFLNGKNIYKEELITPAFIVLGNEANGISEKIEKLCSHRITIPGGSATESLNVATAAAITVGEFYRQSI